MKTIKNLSPLANTTNTERAKIDKRKASKHKAKGNVKNKYGAYIPSMKMYVYAKSKGKLKNIVQGMSDQYRFDIDEVVY